MDDPLRGGQPHAGHFEVLLTVQSLENAK